eukprot:154598_1
MLHVEEKSFHHDYHTTASHALPEYSICCQTDSEENKLLSININQNLLSINKDEDNEEIKELVHDSQNSIYFGFTALTADDYITCEGDIENCNAMKRVFHLLEYYKIIQKDYNICPIYEHLESLKDYGISDVMEDWYHCKIQHFKGEKNNYSFKNNEAINCKNNENCIYVVRNQRDRIRQTYDNKDIDFKNIILMDKLDSIHSYIFHAPSLKITSTDDNIWLNNTNAIIDCNTEQIIYILTNENIFDNK